MATLSRDNVKSLFLRITDTESSGFAYQDLIDKACAGLESSLRENVSASSDIKRCEYAAAAEAAFDYTLESILKDCDIATESGSVKLGSRSPDVVKAAQALKEKAYDLIADLLRDDSFVFFRTADGALGGKD